MATNKRTRHESAELFGGGPQQLPDSDLPTFSDVARYFYVVCNTEKVFATQLKIVQKGVRDIWRKCNPALPLMSELAIYTKLRRFLDKVRLINRGTLKGLTVELLQAKRDKLFDIAACSCELPILPCNSKDVRCTLQPGECTQVHIKCLCKLESRVPFEEREYLRDQREKIGTRGKIQMGPVDLSRAARTLATREERRSARQPVLLRRLDEIPVELEHSFESTGSSSAGEGTSAAGGTGVGSAAATTAGQTYNFRKLDNFILEVVRFDISNNAAAALANGLLKDLGYISPTDRVDIIDSSKIQREKKRICSSTILERQDDVTGLTCIGLDSKRDTKVPVVEESRDGDELRIFKSKGTVDNLTFTVECGPRAGDYLTHRVVPEGQGKGEDLAKIAYSVLEEYDSLETLDAVILDNTPTNTGQHGGLCVNLERLLGRKLHMVGCFLHLNELPLRHLIVKYDGKTISGNKFSGPIGQQICEEIHKQKPVLFEKVETSVVPPPKDVLDDLSNDQRILLEYMMAVSSGTIAKNFVHRRPGPVNHSRWLTTATRILILYTRTEEPSDVLKLLVRFIQRVYGKVWFDVKQEKSFIKAPAILLYIIQEVKAIDQDGSLSEVIFRVLQRNAFCCMSQNFLASLLYSDVEEHRYFAVDKILSIRSNPDGAAAGGGIPTVNFDATHWTDLVAADRLDCEPPCVRRKSNEELELMRISPGPPPSVPLHTQTVERAVKLTSEACRSAYSTEKRHESIVAKMCSRKQRKKFTSKKQYV